jgi:transcriptional regulator with XRE-family HTH domain
MRAKEIGARVRELRYERGLSIEELSERSGVSKSTLTSLEKGVHEPRMSTLRSTARGLDVSLKELTSPREQMIPVSALPGLLGLQVENK